MLQALAHRREHGETFSAASEAEENEGTRLTPLAAHTSLPLSIVTFGSRMAAGSRMFGALLCWAKAFRSNSNDGDRFLESVERERTRAICCPARDGPGEG